MGNKIIIMGPYPPPAGGVATFVNKLYSNLKGKDTLLWAYTDNINFKENQYKINGKLELVPLLLKYSFKAKIVDSWGYFLEYPSTGKLSIINIFSFYALKKLLRFKWIKIIHDGTLPERYKSFSKRQSWIFQKSLNTMDDIVVVNPSLKDWLINYIGINKTITVSKSLLPIDNAFEDKKDALKLNNIYDYIISTVGAFTADYGIKHIVEAVEKIRNEKNINICLIILSSSFTQDEEYKNNLLADRNWIIVSEDADTKNVIQIFKQSKVFVRACRYESYGLSKVEALMCGVPVICTNTGETRGMVTYEFGDVETLKQKICEVLDKDSRMNEYWVSKYKEEAYENLNKILGIIKGS